MILVILDHYSKCKLKISVLNYQYILHHLGVMWILYAFTADKLKGSAF